MILVEYRVASLLQFEHLELQSEPPRLQARFYVVPEREPREPESASMVPGSPLVVLPLWLVLYVLEPISGHYYYSEHYHRSAAIALPG
jgi:hypothetical protein